MRTAAHDADRGTDTHTWWSPGGWLGAGDGRGPGVGVGETGWQTDPPLEAHTALLPSAAHNPYFQERRESSKEVVVV